MLVGFDASDDAAVYQIDEEWAVVSTVDFITPPVDDPSWFGQIAAANSLSDIYAMGGEPLSALNVVMFPTETLGKDVLREILRGAALKLKEAGAVLAGGHSVEDPEPKFGLCVTGMVRIDELLRNAGALPGDAIILTKALGTGVLFNAVREGKYDYRDLEAFLPEIARLNDTGLTVLKKHGVRALTDVSGFGLAGHLSEIAKASGVTVSVRASDLPHYANALRLYSGGTTTGSNRQNRDHLAGQIRIAEALPRNMEELLFDPQTSGGLLAALPKESADAAVKDLRESGYCNSSIIGEVIPQGVDSLIIG